MKYIFSVLFLCACMRAQSESGYALWLRYMPMGRDGEKIGAAQLSRIYLTAKLGDLAPIREEWSRASIGWFGQALQIGEQAGAGVIFLSVNEAAEAGYMKAEEARDLGKEGFFVHRSASSTFSPVVVVAGDAAGLLYGSFQVLRWVNSRSLPTSLHQAFRPRIQWRMLNHWDNLDRYVERGYAGESIWNWQTLPGVTDQRYTDYARANASIGINTTVLTNVNANATVLTNAYLQKVKALADVFRPYHLRVMLTARFSAPMEIGGLKTADPRDPAVQRWWKTKVEEIFRLIPDFGGFLVKANSEGQPGPQAYGRSHAEGANLLAAALAPHGGIVIWRTFVYHADISVDRAKQAYQEFLPLDGQFAPNVMVQVKNGPVDFQPREPFHPLFGALSKTPTVAEFQLTQEYLGFSTHLVYLGTLFRETLDADTHRPSAGSRVANIVSGSAYGYAHTGMAGVANIGSDINWCGHPFAQANWYALGRLAWDPDLDAGRMAEEWIRQTFTNDAKAVAAIRHMMISSREYVVQYMTPMGLHHIMGYGHHYGPAPWYDAAPRPDWNCTYYHQADSLGIGFDRTASGTDALSQYAPAAARNWSRPESTDPRYLLWFHHLSWDYTLPSGQSLWQALCLQYQAGVDGVRGMQEAWTSVSSHIDPERFRQVQQRLQVQVQEATWWKDACLSYFASVSGKSLPAGVEAPRHTLEYYKTLQFPYAPGNGR